MPPSLVAVVHIPARPVVSRSRPSPFWRCLSLQLAILSEGKAIDLLLHDDGRWQCVNTGIALRLNRYQPYDSLPATMRAILVAQMLQSELLLQG